jgi:hypothetical protein
MWTADRRQLKRPKLKRVPKENQGAMPIATMQATFELVCAGMFQAWYRNTKF